ncbi:MAG: hypothetical protein V3S39_11380 [Thermodesulfobacteriota bacterium]
MAKEIWFKCLKCSEEACCSTELEALPEPEVMCPYCHHHMKLSQARIT